MQLLSATRKDSWLPWFLRGVLILIFLIIIGRLVELQLVKGNYYRSLSNGNRVKAKILLAPRGKILARGGEILAESVPNKEGGWTRNYPLAQKSAHVIGYLGEVGESEVGKTDPECIGKGPRKLGSFFGISGLEDTYNCTLSGTDGQELIEVDTAGHLVRVLGRVDPKPGKDIKTNIDFSFQEKVAISMEGKRGGVVVTDPRGEVMALYSSPSYDPTRVFEYLKGADQPLFNRVISGLYHPGSTFKLLVATAGLEDGVIDENYLYEDTGVVSLKTQFGDYSYSNWFFTQNGGVEGKLNIVKAITRSCDTFFYNLGELIGINSLTKWGEKFKLNKPTGIDIKGEMVGLIPTPIWKEKLKSEKWFLGNTYHLSIGQGDLVITPLVANMITSVVASGGSLCLPRLAGKGECEDLKLKDSTIEIIKKGMAGACSSGGTAYPFFDFNPLGLSVDKRVACKTGTAETGKLDTNHAWFTVFAPVDDPEIVVTVLIEEGGEGSKVAAPIAREIVDFWFSKKK